MRVEDFVLYQILKVGFKDSTPIKVFLSMRWSRGKQWRLVPITGGRGWWRRRVRDLVVLGRERERKTCFLSLMNVFIIYISLSEIQLLLLSVKFHTK